MSSVNSFITTFIKALFCSEDLRPLESCFAKDVCAMCFMTGEKGIGRERAAALIVPEGAPFVSCAVTGIEITNPAESIYCTVSDCCLTKSGAAGFCLVRVAACLLKEGDVFSIIQIETSLSAGDAGVPEYQKQTFDTMQRKLEQYKKRLEAASLHCGLSLWDYDIQKRCISQKENSLNMHGMLDVIENVPESLVESGYVHPDSADEFLQMYRRVFRGDEEHRPLRASGFSTDVTEQIFAQRELRRMELKKQQLEQWTLLNMVIDFTADRVLEFDANQLMPDTAGGVRTSGDFLSLLTGHTVDESQAGLWEDMLDYDRLCSRYNAGDTKLHFDFLCEYAKKPVWVQMVLHLEKDKETDHLIGNCYIEDIDRRKRIEMDLKSHAEMDGLTQIYNRKTFQMLVDNMLSARNKEKFIILGILDIDEFKAVNDRYGHVVGDLALQKVANLLKEKFDGDNFVGRLGGDEFTFAFSDFSEFSALRQKLNDLFHLLQVPDDIVTFPVHVSAGIAVAPWDGNTFSELYEKADQALYHVKNQGKNDWQIYQNSTASGEHERWSFLLSKYRKQSDKTEQE